MKKASKFIILGLLIASGLYVLISFIFNKDGTMYWINQFIEWLNKPLPIVGVTALALLVFVWKVVVFIRKTQPNKELLEMRKEHEQYKLASEKEKTELKEQNDLLKGYLIDLCELSTNQKIKNYGKGLLGYGKETTDSETKAE